MNRAIADDAWLRQRIELFDRFCYPSVISQTYSDFQWLVFFAKDSQPFLSECIARWSRHPCFIPIFVDYYDSEYANKLMRTLCHPRTRIIACTRLDNDDAISLDFLSTVRSLLSTNIRPPYMINIDDGFVFFREQIFRNRDTSNMFLTLVERVESIVNPFALDHTRASERFAVVSARTFGSYLHVIHGRNFSRSWIRRDKLVRIPKARLMERFHPDVLGDRELWLVYWMDKIPELCRRGGRRMKHVFKAKR